MTLTVTDLFCGAGGSSLGAAGAGLELVMAANHWATAIDVHQAHFPDAAHDVADVSQVDPRRYPRTDILLASPECTNHSQARGVSRRRQDPTLWDAPDPSAERSRATMWDVVRFAEQMHYTAIVVENVVEATKWVLWPAWLQAMDDLGYHRQILSHNSMHHGVPQSRDRIYVVFWRDGITPDLELEQAAWCSRCDATVPVRQAWKNCRTVGRYRQQWYWACTSCGAECETATEPAASIIDWNLPTPRVGDRKRPLAAKTRQRILAGLQRYGWTPITTAGAGNTYEATPSNRARPVTEPLPVQQTTATTAVAIPPGFLVQTAGDDCGSRIRPIDTPHPTVCASDDRRSLVVPPALLMRNNTGGAEMCTPVDEPARTVTTAGHQSLLLPYYGQSEARPTDRPMPTVTTRDRCALIDLDTIVDDCGFRMLEPYEIAAAMAFPTGYIPRDLTKRDQVKLAGNAVTPPTMQWITGRLARAIGARA